MYYPERPPDGAASFLALCFASLDFFSIFAPPYNRGIATNFNVLT